MDIHCIVIIFKDNLLLVIVDRSSIPSRWISLLKVKELSEIVFLFFFLVISHCDWDLVIRLVLIWEMLREVLLLQRGKQLLAESLLLIQIV